MQLQILLINRWILSIRQKILSNQVAKILMIVNFPTPPHPGPNTKG